MGKDDTEIDQGVFITGTMEEAFEKWLVEYVKSEWAIPTSLEILRWAKAYFIVTGAMREDET